MSSESNEELARLIEESKARVAAMTPEQLAEMHHQQAQSYARSLQPCPHGKRDFEECTACRHEALGIRK